MPLWAVPAIIGGISTLLGADAADDAADAEVSASQAAAAEARRQFDLTRQDTAPYRNVGSQALNALGGIYGYDATRDPVGQATQQNALIQSGSGGYGGTPLNQADWQAVNNVWGQIRPAAQFSDINWSAHGGQNFSPEAAQFLGNNWGNIRRAANFGDINWNAGIVGTPGYQPQQISGTSMYTAPINGQQPRQYVNGLMTEMGLDGAPINSRDINFGPDTSPSFVPPSGGAAPGPSGPDYSSFFQSPDYNFRRTEGMRDLGNTFSARGMGQSGNALRALTEFNSNLAAGEFGNYFNRQAALAGIGQTATGMSANAGLATAGMTGNALQNAGASRASGILGQNAAIAGGLTSGYENWLYGRQRRQTPSGRNGSWG